MQIKIKDKQILKKPEQIAKILQEILANEEKNDQLKEHCWVIGLNSINQIQYLELVSLGILNASLVHPREVFRLAIQKSAAQIIIAHNHPSGSLGPSEDDLTMTIRFKKAGELLGIELIDHIIINQTSFISLKEKKLL